jgi:hypothetical protein
MAGRDMEKEDMTGFANILARPATSQYRRWAVVGLAALWGIAGPSRAMAAEKSPPKQFSRDVAPILSDKCYKCHGPDQTKRKADLRLDLRESAERVLSPDAPADSELLRRITTADPDDHMPPPESKLELAPAEIETLRQWIHQGAPYQRHWSFRPIDRPAIPETTQSDWPENEIDHFILAQLEQAGLAPMPRADKETLIRRVSFALVGLPPTMEDIDAFIADDSDDAYATLVDRTLNQAAYGERMAADWLDLARYSDTYGYQVDRDRFVWPWRDWVIRAFNANMPYDEFVIRQLAGDLLTNAGRDEILATTFNRLHPQKVEGGSVPEEFRVEYVADRVHTFSTAFLGLTLECARCHDHKYDPITQKEYYQFFAFFNNIDEAGLYSYFTPAIPTPTLLLPDEPAQNKIIAIEKQIADEEKKLQSLADSRREAFGQWLTARGEEATIPGQIAHLDFEEAQNGPNVGVPGQVGNAIKLTGDDGIELKVGNFRRFEPFSVSLWMNTPDVKDRAVVFHRSRAWTDAASRGYQLLLEDGKLSAALIHFWPGNAIGVRATTPLPANEWHHVAVTYDGSSRAAGLSIYLNGKPTDIEVVRDHLVKNITGGGGDNITIGERFRDRGFTNGLVDEFKVFDRQLSAIEVSQLRDGKSLADAIKKPIGELTADEKAALFEYFLAAIDEDFRNQRTALREARRMRSEAVDEIPEIMVMQELPEPRPAFVLKRGAYDAPGEPVQAGTPKMFPPLPHGQPRDRLALARWLTGPDHPLTARVAVNRFWQMCFGNGLIGTPEDFGSQGTPPTHPELLDWLARDFMDHDWDIKRLLKTIVMSATYRQSSEVTADHRAADPQNRLLASAPRYRLPAEMIRDNALSVSGLLVSHIGGPPVRPYEVNVSFKPVDRDKGDGLYRRSLYTYWKRTAPAPVMMSLDASKRDVCQVKRERTASPLQALVLLNDPQFIEAARMLGQQVIKKHGDDAGAAIEEMFRGLTSRRPSSQEMNILTRLHGEQLAAFQENPNKAVDFLKTGDVAADASVDPARLAAISMVASTLMNFSDCVIVR